MSPLAVLLDDLEQAGAGHYAYQFGLDRNANSGVEDLVPDEISVFLWTEPLGFQRNSHYSQIYMEDTFDRYFTWCGIGLLRLHEPWEDIRLCNGDIP